MLGHSQPVGAGRWADGPRYSWPRSRCHFVIRHSCFVIPRQRPLGRCRGYVTCFSLNLVESSALAAVSSPVKDITFACSHCSSPLVVDAAAAGMTLPCQKCGKPIQVPAIPTIAGPRGAAAEPNNRVAELRRQLKENDSQRTEVTGYINQLSIQLHRWQLRLQTLEERRKQLENDLQDAK